MVLEPASKFERQSGHHQHQGTPLAFIPIVTPMAAISPPSETEDVFGCRLFLQALRGQSINGRLLCLGKVGGGGLCTRGDGLW